MNPNKTTSTNWALILIAVALVGAGVSYHFTLESRFASIEQKLDQNSQALQQYQASQESIFTSKADALDNLGKEVDALQASLQPLGKATQEQTQSLSDLRKQIASLQQSQQAQQDAQKKLSDYAGQLDKIKHDDQTPSAQIPASTPLVSPPAPPALLTPHASTSHVLLPFPPRADSAVDLRPAQTTAMADDASVRALPVALPVIQP
jgi:uncharacterized membrane-anchored protein YhcB (DUF1043 family)